MKWIYWAMPEIGVDLAHCLCLGDDKSTAGCWAALTQHWHSELSDAQVNPVPGAVYGLTVHCIEVWLLSGLSPAAVCIMCYLPFCLQ